jgi:sterol desaturase/sphingolipid hydroxylase (fatty acid hydroxylase superfamily)
MGDSAARPFAVAGAAAALSDTRRVDPLAWLIVIGVGIGGYWGTIALGPLLGLPLGTTVVTIACVLTIAACERLRPYEGSWLRSHDDVGTDVAHALFSDLATKRLLDAVLGGLGVAVAAALGPRLGAGIWPTAWPVSAQLALALLLVELFQYWMHRCEHEWSGWMWRVHATHHSAPRLYWLNAARLHPGDTALLYLTSVVPLVLLGAPPLVIALFTLFDGVFGVIQHCNVRLALGPLNWVLSTPELHRWHHSRRIEEANANYGSNLIVWDLVFRTYFLPPDRRPPSDIGVAGMPAFPRDYVGQVLSPLRWEALAAADQGRRAAGSQ